MVSHRTSHSSGWSNIQKAFGWVAAACVTVSASSLLGLPPSISVPRPRPLTWKKTRLIPKRSRLHDHGVLNRVPFRRHMVIYMIWLNPPSPPPTMPHSPWVNLVAFLKCFIIQVTPGLRLLHPPRCWSASSRMSVSSCNHDEGPHGSRRPRPAFPRTIPNGSAGALTHVSPPRMGAFGGKDLLRLTRSALFKCTFGRPHERSSAELETARSRFRGIVPDD